MDISELRRLYNQQERIEITWPGVRREATPYVVRHIPTRDDDDGFVLYSRLDETSAGAQIEEQIEFFRAQGVDFEWKLYDWDSPPDLGERLAARGFEVGEAEAILVLDIHHAPPALLEPVRHDLRRIRDPAQLVDVQAVEELVWNKDESPLIRSLEAFLRENPDEVRIYAGYNGGRPVCAAWVYLLPGSQFASLWGGSTLPEYRGRGFYSALLAARLQDAQEKGFRFLTVDASPMSRPILEKLGFRFLGYSYPCIYRFQ